MNFFNKGFTLIELLAVIIILAIVALIATPIILNVIEDSRDSANMSQAEILYSGAQTLYASLLLSDDAELLNKISIGENVYSFLETTNEKPEVGNLYFNGSEIYFYVYIDDVCYGKDFFEKTITKKDLSIDECNKIPEIDITILGKLDDVILKDAYVSLELDETGCKYDVAGKNYSYGNGCYYAGQVDNYLWYNGFMWNIMGVNSDGSIKLITSGNLAAIPFGGSEYYSSSYAKDWLNNYFMANFNTSTDELISFTDSSKVRLLDINEYNAAGGASSYLNINQYFWVVNGDNMYSVNDVGAPFYSSTGYTNGMRPVINLNSDADILYGTGTLKDYYVVKSNINYGSLLENKNVGDYVDFDGHIYRIMEHIPSVGTKLVYDGALGKTTFNSSGVYSTSTLFNKINSEEYLDELIPTMGDKVVDYLWKQSSFLQRDIYTKSINNTNVISQITAKVGVPKIGEILSGNSHTMLTNNLQGRENSFNFWLLNYNSSNYPWYMCLNGTAYKLIDTYETSVRPVIVVDDSVIIKSGKGDPNSPYILG